MSSSALETAIKDPSFYQRLFFNYRLSTFNNWPFDRKSARSKVLAKCTSDLLAKAGFVHDSGCCAVCVFCGKPLEFEAEDDPFVEHRSHSPECVFIDLMDKPEEDRTIRDIKPLIVALLTEASLLPLKRWSDEIELQINKTHSRLQFFEDVSEMDKENV